MKARLVRTVGVLGITAITGVTSACGFFIVQAPPENYAAMPYYNCTEGNAGPIVDLLASATYLIAAVNPPDQQNPYYGPTYSTDAMRAMSVAASGVMAASAVVGFNKTSRCRAARRELFARQGSPSPFARPFATGPDTALFATVEITPRDDTLRVGGVVQLTATGKRLDGTTLPGRQFAWTSSNDAIASVNGSGQVVANAVGTAVIAARVGYAVGTARIVVVPPR